MYSKLLMPIRFLLMSASEHPARGAHVFDRLSTHCLKAKGYELQMISAVYRS